MDTNFGERVRYDIPADLELWEAWDYDEEANVYFYPPFSAHYVPGVLEACRFQTFKAQSRVGRGTKDGQLLALAAGLPRGKLCVIPRAGHLANLERPKEFNDCLMKFLRTLPAW